MRVYHSSKFDRIGSHLCEPREYQKSILYFEKLVMVDGTVAETLYRFAVCHCLLGAFAATAPLIAELKDMTTSLWTS